MTPSEPPAPSTVWMLAESAVVAGDAARLEQLLRDHAQVLRGERPRSTWLSLEAECPGIYRLPEVTGTQDACSIIADKHHFERWDQFAAFTKAVKDPRSAVAQFEAAADALVTGDVTTLEHLLRENPDLIRARSPRRHRSTLLHYVGANGVEGFRQRTPENAVQIAALLLAAGAAVDAEAEMYGGGATTLGLVATSVHPRVAELQHALIEILLAHGAAIDHFSSAGSSRGLVYSCLANGQDEAAEFLASLGASLDLTSAAGVGRLDVVQTFFNKDGGLNATATARQMKDGLFWACLYGRVDVVDFLLKRGASTDQIDETWGSTPLGWALYGWKERSAAASARYYEVVQALVAAGSAVRPEWRASEHVRADPRMLAALTRAR